MEDLTTITYHFEDGGKQVSNINENVIFDDKKRKRSKEQIHQIFVDTAHDMGAVSFEY